MQYTIRAVPDEIDRPFGKGRGRESMSLNAVVIDALARGPALDVALRGQTLLDYLEASQTLSRLPGGLPDGFERAGGCRSGTGEGTLC